MRRQRLSPATFAALAVLCLFSAGCDDMHDQPSFQPQEAPRLTPPENAVPQRGVEVLDRSMSLQNPVPADADSKRRGARLYEINCRMCHGGKEGAGEVGKKLQPPPPDLHQERVQQLGDGELYKRISLGFGRMPAFDKWLSPPQRWDIVNYLRTFEGN
ncbi:MAG: cytochrome c [Desulfuromonadales bacterium]|nr:cytochrome c [Desulfuromonadales bacterium]NIR33750.1 cytochrome c [Desulfuromonadales bacterium]NIS43746.1 cytochrome c [Desulfuromonadales bacterium]